MKGTKDKSHGHVKRRGTKREGIKRRGMKDAHKSIGDKMFLGNTHGSVMGGDEVINHYRKFY